MNDPFFVQRDEFKRDIEAMLDYLADRPRARSVWWFAIEEYARVEGNRAFKLEKENPQPADVVVPITVISADGKEPVHDWHWSYADEPELVKAGFRNLISISTVSADDGMYELEMRDSVARAIYQSEDQESLPRPWSWSDEPEWSSYQRGEGGVWMHLRSGEWIGIAPIDLESYYINNEGAQQ